MIPSLIRTYVPLLVAFLVSWVISLGIPVDSETQAVLVSGLGTGFGAGYYAAVRFLERRFPWATVLLGSSQQPTQYAPAATPATVAAAPGDATAAADVAAHPVFTENHDEKIPPESYFG